MSQSGVSGPVVLQPNYGSSGGVVTLTDASYTVSANQSGCVFFAPVTTAARTITLPSVVAGKGAHFRFIFTAKAAGANDWAITTGSADLVALSLGFTGAFIVVPATGTTCTRSVNANTNAGDFVDMYCDGSKYYIFAVGYGNAATFVVA
jgi:hypothetical protein